MGNFAEQFLNKMQLVNYQIVNKSNYDTVCRTPCCLLMQHAETNLSLMWFYKVTNSLRFWLGLHGCATWGCNSVDHWLNAIFLLTFLNAQLRHCFLG